MKVDVLGGEAHRDYQSVRVDDSGVSLGGRLVLPRAEVASVSVALRDRTSVYVRKKDAPGYSFTFTDLAVTGTKAEKLAALRELGSESAGSYRDGRVPRERLWGLVEGGRVDGATRARAAIALSGGLANEDRERLRIATDARVSPKLRVAMDAFTPTPTKPRRAPRRPARRG